jgi:hypothetical protein
LPEPIYGVTSEGVSSVSALSEALERHGRDVTVRIVFQEGTNPKDYTTRVNTVRQHAYVMGEILDSTGLAGMTTQAYRARAKVFVEQFGDSIDIWEIGNELNGEWVGTPTTINAKVLAAYEVVHQEYAHLNLRSAVTLNALVKHHPTNNLRTAASGLTA